VTAFDKYEEIVDHAMDRGAAELIGKPFNFEQINDLLNKYLPGIRKAYQAI